MLRKRMRLTNGSTALAVWIDKGRSSVPTACVDRRLRKPRTEGR